MSFPPAVFSLSRNRHRSSNYNRTRMRPPDEHPNTGKNRWDQTILHVVTVYVAAPLRETDGCLHSPHRGTLSDPDHCQRTTTTRLEVSTPPPFTRTMYTPAGSSAAFQAMSSSIPA